MGIPVIQAPGEAEAQCAAIAKLGLAYAAGSEDMDTLTFSSPILLRHLTFSEARKMPISEINLAQVLEGLQMSMEQFVDLCILLGCDYCDSIKGIGPTRALSLIRQFGNIETILENIDKEKHPIPEDWPFQDARQLFLKPSVLSADDPQLTDLKWEKPDEEALINFMVTENGFNEKRIRAGMEKLIKARGTSTQGRLDSFFKVTTTSTASPTSQALGDKRKGTDKRPAAAKGPKKGKIAK